MSAAATTAAKLSRDKYRLLWLLIEEYALHAESQAMPPLTRRTGRHYAAKLEAFVIARALGNTLRREIAARGASSDGGAI